MTREEILDMEVSMSADERNIRDLSQPGAWFSGDARTRLVVTCARRVCALRPERTRGLEEAALFHQSLENLECALKILGGK